MLSLYLRLSNTEEILSLLAWSNFQMLLRVTTGGRNKSTNLILITVVTIYDDSSHIR